jgi:hypothetical protein
MLQSLLLLLLLLLCNANANEILSQKVLDRYNNTFEIPSFQWDDLLDTLPSLKANISTFKNTYNSTLASKIVSIPVYATMTTTHFRIGQIHKTIRTIFKGVVIPDHLYVFISKDQFLLDKGVPPKNIPEQLRQIIREGYPVSIIYTKNIGPHRKLLPLLASKYNEKCIIVTYDDENKRKEELKWYLPSLLKYYAVSDKSSIIALRSRRVGYCDVSPYKTLTYNYWVGFPRQTIEMLLLPTGTGSIMYQPSLLHPLIFSQALRNATITADDIAFRLSSMAYNIPVVSGCKTSNFSEKVVFGTKCNYRRRKSSTDGKRKLLADDNSKDDENVFYDDDVSEESDGTVSSIDEGRKLMVQEKDDPKSLYLSFNLKQGNDRQWNSGVELFQKYNLLDMATLVKTRLFIERSMCFKKDNVTKEMLHRYIISSSSSSSSSFNNYNLSGKRNGVNAH